MPINMSCPSCGKTLAAPDSAAGKRAKCPACSQVMIVPAAPQAEGSGPPPQPPSTPFTPPSSGPGGENWLDQISGGAPAARASAPVPGGEERKPCPECGEMIMVGAAKCRFCGAVFDPRLRGTGFRAAGISQGPPGERAQQIRQCFTIWWVCYVIGFVLLFVGGIAAALSMAGQRGRGPAEPPLAMIAFFGLGGLVLLAGAITYLVLLYKLWTTVQDGRARTTPGYAVGFLFIPCFNIYWQFVSFWGLSKELNRVSREYNVGAPQVNEGIALAACILPFCGWVPFVGAFAGLALIICAIIAVKQMCDAAVVIVGGPRA